MARKTKILLLGNGILQAFGGESWNDFLSSICKRSDLPSPDKIKCPEPLKAILLTGDRVDIAMKEKCADILNRAQISEKLAMFLKTILSLGFDHIFTTNYTYELEQAAVYPEKLSEYKLKKMAASTTGVIDKKYLLHTYNKVICNGIENKIWHVHGESRKPDSTILGHYYYGNSLFKIKDALDKIRITNSIDEDPQTWAEAFIFGDIYCLGFGYGLCEFDLWWLLNRKAREKFNAGKLCFYEPYNPEQWEKIDLMKLMKTTAGTPLVNIIDLGYNSKRNMDWEKFYTEAIEDLKQRINLEYN
ncbi:MAG: hypothetical protein E7617_05025 [Ruminococcaceae bacterium]|nr:hypothetical protein [Oscillospiraceae bacterium]